MIKYLVILSLLLASCTANKILDYKIESTQKLNIDCRTSSIYSRPVQDGIITLKCNSSDTLNNIIVATIGTMTLLQDTFKNYREFRVRYTFYQPERINFKVYGSNSRKLVRIRIDNYSVCCK